MGYTTLETLNSLFSKARILPYLIGSDSAENVLAKYNTNIILSEAMIPTLHYFEICLRNRLDQIIQKYYGLNWLIDSPYQLMISDQDLKKIDQIVLKVNRENKRVAIHDDIVAQMSFGFWCSFFHRKYDTAIWHRKESMKIIFPNITRCNKKRSYVEGKILRVKEIRNRIAHHEPVWNGKVSLIDYYLTCHELIRAMSQDAINMFKLVDRFPTVHQKSMDM